MRLFGVQRVLLLYAEEQTVKKQTLSVKSRMEEKYEAYGIKG